MSASDTLVQHSSRRAPARVRLRAANSGREAAEFVPYSARQAAALARALRRRIAGEVRFSDGDRALYATDGSNYRQVPIGVVIPRSQQDVIATMALCREHGAPFLSRGGGTSLAGQCCNTAVIVDYTKYLKAWNRARRSPKRRREASSDLRARSVDAQPQHARRNDRQQLLRRPFRHVGPHRRQRAGTRHPHL